MGIETGTALLIGAGISAATAVGSAKVQNNAAKHARREAATQREHQEQQDAIYAKEAARLKKQQQGLQEKINKGLARSNRARVRGGLFGEGEQTPGNLTATLG